MRRRTESEWGRVALRLYEILAMRGRPLTVRMAVVLAPTTAVAITFGWMTVTSSFDQVRPLDEATRYAAVSTASLALVETLQDERDRAARAVVRDRDELGLDAAYDATEDAIAAFDRALAAVPEAAFGIQVARARAGFAELAALRTRGYGSRLPPLATIEAYGEVILPVIHVGRGADSRAVRLSGAPGVYARTAGGYDLVLAIGALSQRRALVTAMLARDRAEPGEADAVLAFSYLSRIELDAFQAAASAGSLDLFARVRAAEAVRGADGYVRQVLAATDGYADANLSVDAWVRIATEQLTPLRQVVTEGARGAQDAIGGLRFSAWRAALGNTVLFVAATTLAVLFALAVGGGIVRDLRRLRRGMLSVANTRLPRTVRALSGQPPEFVDLRVRPIGGGARDEIGQVADAFDTVHREAVRLAAAQARMRTTTNAVMSTVAYRAQQLVGQQLAVISELEREQVDPLQLDALFRLDHLATRMRRYGEVLLVLADDDPGQRRIEPALLVEVVQAATAEIEDYARIELLHLPAVRIAPVVVVDLAHLLAELLDNATAYSAPGSTVHVLGSRQRDGQVLVEIHDDGPGLPAEAVAKLNSRLTGVPTVKLGAEPQLGLFIARLLADRHQIRVRLSSEPRGTTASVLLPASVVGPAPSTSAYALPEPIGFGPIQVRV
ncbi:sensor histidine kinase [Actinomycetes bacterium KLBMP 9797]